MLQCDGQYIPLPSLQGIAVLNIPSYAGGTNFWGGTKEDDVSWGLVCALYWEPGTLNKLIYFLASVKTNGCNVLGLELQKEKTYTLKSQLQSR